MWITIMVFRPRYLYPTIAHTTLSCLAIFKRPFYLIIFFCIFVIFFVFVIFLACYNNINGDTDYFYPLFYLAAPLKAVLLWITNRSFQSSSSASSPSFFPFLLPSWPVTAIVMVKRASSIHCFTLLPH